MLVFIVTTFWLCFVLVYLWLLLTSSGNVRAKLLGFPIAFLHLALTRDSKWKRPTDPQETLSIALKSPESVRTKRVYFVRHGESMWNEVFNRGFDLGIIWRFLSSVLHEFHLLPFADSVFWDSPLSPLGIRQAVQLSSWVETADPKNTHAAVLRGDSDLPSLICTSNLRRAVATTLTAFSGRLLRRTREKVHILSSGQEITRNIDGYSLSAPGSYPGPSWVEVQQPELDKVVSAIYSGEHLDARDNRGNKPLSSNGLQRMTEFCNWVFNNDAAREVPYVILGGHSLWFREFFKTFLPHSSTHESKLKKMVNCGVVAFDLLSFHGRFVVDPDSIQVVYGGFEDKHKQKN
jgi:hypothetical protein